MKKLLRYTACLAILVMVVALFTGCILTGKVTGGGWFIDGQDNKCTFGFNAHGDCREGEGLIYKGQFQFNDHDGCKIHAKVLSLLDFGDTYALFHGVDDKELDVYVYVEDMGQPGADPGDYIAIWYDADHWWDPPTYEGELGGGNLKVHKEK